MSARSSLVVRAIGAVLLMVGFYVLALVIAGLLLAAPVAEWRFAHRVDGRIAIFCIVGGIAILRAIVPRPDRFDPPGPGLDAATQPRLFAALEEVARATGQAMPAEVYLVADVNAWVAQRGGVMGFGSRRVMGLGLPLLQTISVDELRAILAHEFGHYHGGDTMLGPWIYKTRAAIGRTLESLARHSGLLMKPFEWYGAGFLRITHAISRRQEYAADALAARTVGAIPLASGLRATHGAGGAFPQYWLTEVGPIVDRGFLPPIVEGFSHFLATPTIAKAVSASIEKELAEPTVDPYDTHPPLRERIRALGVPPEAAARSEGPRAITLLEDVAALETTLIRHLLGAKNAKELRALAWQDAGSQAWSAIWRDLLKRSGNRLDHVTVLQVPALARDLAGAAERLAVVPRRALANDETAQAVSHLLATALAVALLDHGWSISAMPGDVVVLSKDGRTMTPFDDLGRLTRGELSLDEWKEQWGAIGLLDLQLGLHRRS